MLSLLLRVAPAREARRQVSSTSREALLGLRDRLLELERGSGAAEPAEAAVAAWALEGLAGLLTTVEHLLGQFLPGEGDGAAGRDPGPALGSLRQALLEERDHLESRPGAGYGRLAQIIEHLADLLGPQEGDESGS